MSKISKHELAMIGHVLYDRLKEEAKSIQDLPMREYFEFDKYTVNPTWYADLGKPEDVMVEIAVVKGNHSEKHFHKESHALNIILGGEHGVNNPPEGAEIVAGEEVTKAVVGKRVYFEEELPHTFNSPSGEPFYFLSIQSPPLDKLDGTSDYHYQN